ncbi:HutD family protein [Chromobacterium sphagni]|nr:HutD family protein [Chromobacterium sphagni]
MRLFSADDFRSMPWANGGGQTCELFRLAHPARADAFAVRLSIADVAQGGPFSHFPGVDRLLGLLEGDGMELSLDDGGSLRLDAPGQIASFGGEAAVQCRLLGGALRDCNLMLARDWGRGELSRLSLSAGQDLSVPVADMTLLYLQRGEWRCDGRLLPPACLLAAEGEALALQAQTDGVAWLARVSRLA